MWLENFKNVVRKNHGKLQKIVRTSLQNSFIETSIFAHQAIPYIVSDMALNQAFPLVHFYQSCYCFNGMGMEYSLNRQFGVSSCGQVSRVLDGETNGLGSIPKGVIFGIFFFLTFLQKQVSQGQFGWFFSKLPQNEFSFPGQLGLVKLFFFNCRKTSVFQVS